MFVKRKQLKMPKNATKKTCETQHLTRDEMRNDAYVLDIHDIFATTGDLLLPVGDPFCRLNESPTHILRSLAT